MSDENANVVTVVVMDRPYKIKCAPTEAADLQEAAKYLTQQMKVVRESVNALSTDRIAVVAALNMAHEFIGIKKQKSGYMDAASQRVRGLRDRIQQVLSENEKMSQ